jgi:hypothetical protein
MFQGLRRTLMTGMMLSLGIWIPLFPARFPQLNPPVRLDFDLLCHRPFLKMSHS